MTLTPDLVLFIILAIVAIVAALGMLFSANAVHSALFLILNFATVAVLYLVLSAPFSAMVQGTIDAGAIMVLFLFGLVLLGAGQRRRKGSVLRWQAPLAIVLGAVLLAEAAYVLFVRGAGSGQPLQPLSAGFGSPSGIGEVLFRQYLLPFEVTSVLLLVAMVGAIVLSREEGSRK